MIKAVIFDFFGVLCSDQYWQYVKADKQTEGVFQDYARDVNSGNMPWSTFVKKIAEATGSSVAEINQLYESEQIDPRVAHLIHELHGPYKTGLITNAHHDFIDDLLVKNHLNELFDSVIVSSRVGAVKPNPALFEAALDELGIDAKEAVYFDDIERHVASANELGLHAFLYTDFDQAKRDLSSVLHQD